MKTKRNDHFVPEPLGSVMALRIATKWNRKLGLVCLHVQNKKSPKSNWWQILWHEVLDRNKPRHAAPLIADLFDSTVETDQDDVMHPADVHNQLHELSDGVPDPVPGSGDARHILSSKNTPFEDKPTRESRSSWSFSPKIHPKNIKLWTGNAVWSVRWARGATGARLRKTKKKCLVDKHIHNYFNDFSKPINDNKGQTMSYKHGQYGEIIRVADGGRQTDYE